MSKVRKQNLDSLPDTATCKLCGEIISPDPVSLGLHLFMVHPIEYLQSASGQNMLKSLSDIVFDFGKSLTRKKS